MYGNRPAPSRLDRSKYKHIRRLSCRCFLHICYFAFREMPFLSCQTEKCPSSFNFVINFHTFTKDLLGKPSHECLANNTFSINNIFLPLGWQWEFSFSYYGWQQSSFLLTLKRSLISVKERDRLGFSSQAHLLLYFSPFPIRWNCQGQLYCGLRKKLFTHFAFS